MLSGHADGSSMGAYRCCSHLVNASEAARAIALLGSTFSVGYLSRVLC